MITIGNNNKIKNSNIGSDNKYKKILTELEEWLKDIIFDPLAKIEFSATYNKLQQLKEKYK